MSFGLRIASRLTAAAMQAAVFVILARSLGPAIFGIFVLGQSVGLVASNLGSFGLPLRALRLSAESDVGLASRILRVGFLSSTASSLLVFVLLAIVSGDLVVLCAAALTVGVEQYAGVLQAVFAGRQRPTLSSICLIMPRLAPSLFLVAAVICGREALDGYIVGQLVNVAALIVHQVFIGRVSGGKRRLIAESRGFWFTSAGSSLANLDVLIVFILLGDGAAGIYGAASRLVSPLTIVASSLLAIVLPVASHLKEAQAREGVFRAGTRWMVIYAVASSVAAPWVSSQVVGFLGSAYSASWAVIVAFVVSVGLSGVSQALLARLLSAGKEWIAGTGITLATLLGLLAFAVLVMGVGMETLWACPLLVQGAVLMALALARRSVSADASPTRAMR